MLSRLRIASLDHHALHTNFHSQWWYDFDRLRIGVPLVNGRASLPEFRVADHTSVAEGKALRNGFRQGFFIAIRTGLSLPRAAPCTL